MGVRPKSMAPDLCFSNNTCFVIFGIVMILYTAFEISLIYYTATREVSTTALTSTNVTITRDLCDQIKNKSPYVCGEIDNFLICYGVTIPLIYSENVTYDYDSLTMHFCNKQNADDYADFYRNQTRNISFIYYKYNPKEWHMQPTDKFSGLIIIVVFFNTIILIMCCGCWWYDFYYRIISKFKIATQDVVCEKIMKPRRPQICSTDTIITMIFFVCIYFSQT